MIYLELFWSYFKIGIFSFGGGYAALPLIQNEIVTVHNWMTNREYWDIVTISQMTPGPISINAATFVGTKIGGILGAFAATLGFVLPSVIVVSLLFFIYSRYRKMSVMNSILAGLRPVVVGLISSAGILLLISSFWSSGKISSNFGDLDFTAIIVFFACFLLLRKTKINPLLVLLSAGAVGGVVYSVF